MSYSGVALALGFRLSRSLRGQTQPSSCSVLLPVVSTPALAQRAGANSTSRHSHGSDYAYTRPHSCSAYPSFGCMRASAVHSQPSLLHSPIMPRCSSWLSQRRRVSNNMLLGDMLRSSSSGFHSSSAHYNQQHHQEQQQRCRHSTTAHAAASSATWGQPHDHHEDNSHSSGKQQAGSCGCNGAHSHSHGHHHHHGHSHSHGHHHHHHYHTGAGTHSNPILSALSKTGLFSLAEHLEHNTAYTVTSVSCFIAALLLPYCVSQGLLQAATGALLGKAALAVTYVLSGIPQLAETVGAAVTGKIDTHVLMSLSIIGTLYMGMAQEGALLLLLFRVSHLLEDRLTEKAAGSLQRLFDSVPNTASVVEVDRNGAPRVATTQQVSAESVALGQHVLVRPGEQVPLDGTITWGTANLSLQHISGEAQPVKLGPGQEVPAGSLSTDGLLVIRVEATAENSTPSRIAQMAAEAQARRPQLTRWLDGVGEVWSKAVIGATIVTAAVLPLLGVPFLGDRGALYRAMGVLTAGSPCALALVPLAYACAIAAITAKGILIKSGAALDALAACKTIALDKTGTITTGSLNLAEGFVLNLVPSEAQPVAAAAVSGGSSSSRPAGWINVRAMDGLDELLRADGSSSSSSSNSASIGTRTSYSAAAQAYTSSTAAASFDESALKCAVALSRLSNHPVSRAMVDSAPALDADVAVLSFVQVPGAGVEGVCKVGDTAPVHVRFGSADWVNSYITDRNTVSEVNGVMKQHMNRPSRATAVLSISQLSPVNHAQQQQEQQQCWGELSPATTPVAATAAEDLGSNPAVEPDMAVVLDDGSSSSGLPDAKAASSSRPTSPYISSRSSSRIGSRPVSPSKFIGSNENRDGSVTFSFDFDEDVDDIIHSAVPAAAAAVHSAVQTTGNTHHDQQQQEQVSQNTSSATADHHHPQQQLETSDIQISQNPRSDLAERPVPSPSSSISGSMDLDGTYGPPGQPTQLALLCFEDVIQAGVPTAVQQLQSGNWSSSMWRSSSTWMPGSGSAPAEKDVIMLTGDNQRVAKAVAAAVGITDYKAGLKPEDKLAYVQQAAAASSATGGKPGSGAHGLLMAGDGINDAPALAAAQVGVAIASTPKDMVAAAADIIVLNGQGITNLPWLFHVADRTHTILKQNLALALASVAVATLPTVAGMFPLWLAVTLHEGSTLLVALNSLRLLLEAPPSKLKSSSSKMEHHEAHSTDRSTDHQH